MGFRVRQHNVEQFWNKIILGHLIGDVSGAECIVDNPAKTMFQYEFSNESSGGVCDFHRWLEWNVVTHK